MNREGKKGIRKKGKDQGVSSLGRGRNYKSPWRWQGVGVTCFAFFGSVFLQVGLTGSQLTGLQHDYLFKAEGS